jgi:hypothetical protein
MKYKATYVEPVNVAPEVPSTIPQAAINPGAPRNDALTVLAVEVAYLHGRHHPLDVPFGECEYRACRLANKALA